MYYYLYDTFLSDKKYEKVIDRIKTRLLDLEIQGRHERLTLLKNIEELITDEVKRGANTVIVLGNDKTFLKVVEVVAKEGLTLGLIPLGPDNTIAQCLGIPLEDAACDVLAARKIVSFDLGQASAPRGTSGQYFFSHLKINKNLNRLTIQKDNYQMVPQPGCVEVAIYNFHCPDESGNFERRFKKYSAQDQQLELMFKNPEKSKGWLRPKTKKLKVDSLIQGAKFEIKSFEYIAVLLDGYKVLKTPLTINVVPNKLKVIVGKTRLKNIQ